MTDSFALFERIVRRSQNYSVDQRDSDSATHPLDSRNIHPEISSAARKLFDDGHYSQATFEAFKFIDNIVKTLSGVNESGSKLMMSAFNENDPKIKLNDLTNTSEKDEQSGYRFIFAGSMSAIRNPRGHDLITDDIDTCLDHLSLASVLLRRLETRKTSSA
jgi:uncharacterized protein (TIGR02391 family)